MQSIRLAVLILGSAAAGCAHAITPPKAPAAPAASEALVVLPGFGYSRAGERAFRALAPAMAAQGLDLYLPTYVERGGLDDSRERLRRAIRDARLERYARVHVFAFIAGGWTVNPLVDAGAIPNLTTVVYDRSPYQERAPRVARERLPVLTWLKYGSTVFDVARTPYSPLTAGGVRVGLMVETTPTRFITRFAKAADRQGPYDFACEALSQRYDDCIYVSLNHTELYPRFADVWPELLSFIRDNRFTPSADRTAPSVPSRLAGSAQEPRS